jgi:hypothetical protein
MDKSLWAVATGDLLARAGFEDEIVADAHSKPHAVSDALDQAANHHTL